MVSTSAWAPESFDVQALHMLTINNITSFTVAPPSIYYGHPDQHCEPSTSLSSYSSPIDHRRSTQTRATPSKITITAGTRVPNHICTAAHHLSRASASLCCRRFQPKLHCEASTTTMSFSSSINPS
ncbi:hypothetical protein M0R45_005636 [Rubus argutus]|uniref:Uncharacterized protein n=1 Tax=Rubus argutus TaxID=59490 RepID=A0AAW1YNW2_RUBAR